MQVPDKPVIIEGLGNHLESSSPIGNQWYFDTIVVIPNAVRNLSSAITNKWYSVRVTINGCTSQFSDSYQLNTTVVEERGNILISPNPAREAIKINFIIPSINRVQVEIFDSRAMQMFVQRNVSSGQVIPISNLPAGLYIVKIAGDTGRITTVRN